MTLLVPFDGSPLSETALERAVRFGTLMDEDVLAVTVLPQQESYARQRGWIDDEESVDPDEIRVRLEQQVKEIAPDAGFQLRQPEDIEEASVTMDVIRTIRQVADEVDASILFIGSDNVGRVTEPLASVGDPIAKDQQYDVHIVRHASRDD